MACNCLLLSDLVFLGFVEHNKISEIVILKVIYSLDKIIMHAQSVMKSALTTKVRILPLEIAGTKDIF